VGSLRPVSQGRRPYRLTAGALAGKGSVHPTARRCGLFVIDLRNGDIVQWYRFRGDVTELFDAGVIQNIRCPRGIGPLAPGLEEAMRGEELA
jgi:hypothetical protein